MSSKRAEPADAELEALAGMSEERVDTSDIPEIVDWSGAERGRFYRPLKQLVTIRLDADIVDWFKRRSARYQTAINQALREHIARRG